MALVEARPKSSRRNDRVEASILSQVERPVSPLFAAFRAADLATFVFPRSLAGEADYVFRYLRRRLGLRDEAHAAALRRRVDAQARASVISASLMDPLRDLRSGFP